MHRPRYVVTTSLFDISNCCYLQNANDFSVINIAIMVRFCLGSDDNEYVKLFGAGGGFFVKRVVGGKESKIRFRRS